MSHVHQEIPPFGCLAEFESPERLIWAAKQAREAGYKKIDAYSPFPVHGLAEVVGYRDVRVGWIVFLFGVAGLTSGILLEWWVSVYAYPHNVGGRPLFSWPSFIPVAYECTILFASFSAAIGMLALNGLPRPHHPVFDAKNFDRASQDAFFLCIEATDPKYDSEETAGFLEGLGPNSVSEVKDIK